MGSGPVGDIENHQAEQGEPWPPRIPCPRGQTSPIRPAGSRDRTGPPVQTSRCSVKMRAQKEGIEKGKGLRLGSMELRGRRSSLRLLGPRSEEHTSELQSRENLVCRLLLEK